MDIVPVVSMRQPIRNLRRAEIRIGNNARGQCARPRILIGESYPFTARIRATHLSSIGRIVSRFSDGRLVDIVFTPRSR